ncbi:MAG: AAA family ATPase, partial [Chloroflexi bacterium]|nr:AAA family ATPase [Chloroflexota bacterium]
SVQALLKEISEKFKSDVGEQLIDNYLQKFLPKFVYFDEYSTMRGRISIQDLRHRQEKGEYMDESDRTFLSLLALVGANLQDLENQTSYEYLKAELESASIGISDEIFEYWNQNKQLRVEFDLSPANPNDPPPLNAGTILHVRIWNNRHRVSVPFDERSKGFVWFFSFLSYFSKIEEEEKGDLVLLLDEPGLNLHAMAQYDFLRFIDERLAVKHQVIYTTHSPFMINLKHLDRIRTVQDVDDRGTVIHSDTLSNDMETVFPLQVALGHRLANTLFLAPHCLMVNSASDLIYLQILGELCASKGHQRLDPRWVVIPVGGADNLPTFVSLLGENYVSVAVLMDVTPKNKEKMAAINRNGVIDRRNPIKWVEVAKVRTADIEDILDPMFYLKLVNESYEGDLPATVTMKAITDSDPRIVHRLQAHFESEDIAGGTFDSYRPAAYLLQKHALLRNEIDTETIERAASMFERINAMLPSDSIDVKAVNGRTLAPTL